MVPETMSNPDRLSTTKRRSMRRVRPAMNRLVTTANTPEIEMAWPVCPSVTPRSAAIGVSRLTGMNSEAINTLTHSAMETTAPQAAAAGSGVLSTDTAGRRDPKVEMLARSWEIMVMAGNIACLTNLIRRYNMHGLIRLVYKSRE